MRSPHAFLATLLFAASTSACSGGVESLPPASSGNANEGAPSGQTATSEPTSGSAPFEVHEWGLVDVAVSGPTEIGAGPGHPAPDQPMTVRKPVVYVHVDPGASITDLEVSAHLPGGELLELWPTAGEWPATQTDASSVRWSGLTASACGPERGPVAVTTREMRACATLDGYCEVEDLPGYVTADASCLSAGGFTIPLLFYRGRTSTPTLPLRVTASAAEVRLESLAAGGSSILHLRDGRGDEVAWPTAGASVALPPSGPGALDGDALAHRLDAMLTQAGLTQPEADAFERAWAAELFGPAAAARYQTERARDLSARRSPYLPPPPRLLYVMPEASVDALAELRITPTPRRVRRVMVVRVELSRGR